METIDPKRSSTWLVAAGQSFEVAPMSTNSIASGAISPRPAPPSSCASQKGNIYNRGTQCASQRHRDEGCVQCLLASFCSDPKTKEQNQRDRAIEGFRKWGSSGSGTAFANTASTQ
eukprot:5111022-Amphidinium_carterae.1